MDLKGSEKILKGFEESTKTWRDLDIFENNLEKYERIWLLMRVLEKIGENLKKSGRVLKNLEESK